MDKTLFGALLGHYATRKPKRFLQLDVFGNETFASGTDELMAGSEVRVLIPQTTDARVAARQLKMFAKMLKREPDLMRFARNRNDGSQRPTDFEDDDIQF